MFSIVAHSNLIHFKLRFVFLPFKFVLMFTVLLQFNFFQCRAASLLKIELQAYRVAGAFFRVAGEMRRLPAYYDISVFILFVALNYKPKLAILTLMKYFITQEWCGLNLGNLCNMVANPNRNPGTHMVRIGCIGDTSAPRSPSGCNPDDYAIGIGVTSCNKPHGCHHFEFSSRNIGKSLHFSSYPSHYGYYDQTAFIYVK